MKNLLKTNILLLATIVVCLGSCKKEGQEENLSTELVGTTWASRSSVNPTTSYRILKFRDTKNVDWITKNSSSSAETTSACTYTLIGTTLRIKTDPGTQYELIWTGEISDNQVNLKPDIGSNSMTFKKE